MRGLRLRRRRNNRAAIGFAQDLKDINDPSATDEGAIWRGQGRRHERPGGQVRRLVENSSRGARADPWEKETVGQEDGREGCQDRLAGNLDGIGHGGGSYAWRAASMESLKYLPGFG